MASELLSETTIIINTMSLNHWKKNSKITSIFMCLHYAKYLFNLQLN